MHEIALFSIEQLRHVKDWDGAMMIFIEACRF